MQNNAGKVEITAKPKTFEMRIDGVGLPKQTLEATLALAFQPLNDERFNKIMGLARGVGANLQNPNLNHLTIETYAEGEEPYAERFSSLAEDERKSKEKKGFKEKISPTLTKPGFRIKIERKKTDREHARFDKREHNVMAFLFNTPEYARHAIEYSKLKNKHIYSSVKIRLNGKNISSPYELSNVIIQRYFKRNGIEGIIGIPITAFNKEWKYACTFTLARNSIEKDSINTNHELIAKRIFNANISGIISSNVFNTNLDGKKIIMDRRFAGVMDCVGEEVLVLYKDLAEQYNKEVQELATKVQQKEQWKRKDEKEKVPFYYDDGAVPTLSRNIALKVEQKRVALLNFIKKNITPEELVVGKDNPFIAALYDAPLFKQIVGEKELKEGFFRTFIGSNKRRGSPALVTLNYIIDELRQGSLMSFETDDIRRYYDEGQLITRLHMHVPTDEEYDILTNLKDFMKLEEQQNTTVDAVAVTTNTPEPVKKGRFSTLYDLLSQKKKTYDCEGSKMPVQRDYKAMGKTVLVAGTAVGAGMILVSPAGVGAFSTFYAYLLGNMELLLGAGAAAGAASGTGYFVNKYRHMFKKNATPSSVVKAKKTPESEIIAATKSVGTSIGAVLAPVRKTGNSVVEKTSKVIGYEVEKTKASLAEKRDFVKYKIIKPAWRFTIDDIVIPGLTHAWNGTATAGSYLWKDAKQTGRDTVKGIKMTGTGIATAAGASYDYLLHPAYKYVLKPTGGAAVSIGAGTLGGLSLAGLFGAGRGLKWLGKNSYEYGMRKPTSFVVNKGVKPAGDAIGLILETVVYMLETEIHIPDNKITNNALTRAIDTYFNRKRCASREKQKIKYHQKIQERRKQLKENHEYHTKVRTLSEIIQEVVTDNKEYINRTIGRYETNPTGRYETNPTTLLKPTISTYTPKNNLFFIHIDQKESIIHCKNIHEHDEGVRAKCANGVMRYKKSIIQSNNNMMRYFSLSGVPLPDSIEYGLLLNINHPTVEQWLNTEPTPQLYQHIFLEIMKEVERQGYNIQWGETQPKNYTLKWNQTSHKYEEKAHPIDTQYSVARQLMYYTATLKNKESSKKVQTATAHYEKGSHDFVQHYKRLNPEEKKKLIEKVYELPEQPDLIKIIEEQDIHLIEEIGRKKV